MKGGRRVRQKHTQGSYAYTNNTVQHLRKKAKGKGLHYCAHKHAYIHNLNKGRYIEKEQWVGKRWCRQKKQKAE